MIEDKAAVVSWLNVKDRFRLALFLFRKRDVKKGIVVLLIMKRPRWWNIWLGKKL